MSEKRHLTDEERRQRRAYRKFRRIIFPISRITFLLTLILSIVFFISIAGIGILPGKWLIVFGILLLIPNVYVALIALSGKADNKKKLTQSIVAGVLSLLFLIGSIQLPNYKRLLDNIFNPMPTESELNISIYTLEDSGLTSLASLSGKKVAVQQKLDADAQQYALTQVNRELGSGAVETVPYNGIYEAVDALYNGEVEAVMLSETYVNLLSEKEDYKNFDYKTNAIYTCIQKVSLSYDMAKAGNITKGTFVVGIIGNDEWFYDDLADSTGFRTDVNIVVVVNPVSKKVLAISVPRDSYVAVDGDSSTMDKLTHSTLYSSGGKNGISHWISTMNYLFNTELNYIVKVNFASMVDIVDAIGGIDINNPYAFTANYDDWVEKTRESIHTHYDFPEGNLHLEGKEALAYCRERYSLPNGDFGRNEHQQIVLRAMVNKVTSPAIISKVSSIMSALSGKFMTNMDVNEMMALAQMQLDDLASWDIQSMAIAGETDFGYSYFVGDDLSVVNLNTTSVADAITKIKELTVSE